MTIKNHAPVGCSAHERKGEGAKNRSQDSGSRFGSDEPGSRRRSSLFGIPTGPVVRYSPPDFRSDDYRVTPSY